MAGLATVHINTITANITTGLGGILSELEGCLLHFVAKAVSRFIFIPSSWLNVDFQYENYDRVNLLLQLTSFYSLRESRLDDYTKI